MYYIFPITFAHNYYFNEDNEKTQKVTKKYKTLKLFQNHQFCQILCLKFMSDD